MKTEPQTAQDLIKRLRAANKEELAILERTLAADQRKTIQTALAAAQRRITMQDSEDDRIARLYAFDANRSKGIVLGLDEVGRGPIAGPVAVGGVVLPAAPRIEGINDSKKLSHKQREKVASRIKDVALAWTVCFVEPDFIDTHGVSTALRRAFLDAIHNIEQQRLVPDCILLDGNALKLDTREVNVVKGDAASASIGAASIVAKVARDALMVEYDKTYPVYDFVHNKGYASAKHIEAIRKFGLSPIHRKSFCTAFMQETLF